MTYTNFPYGITSMGVPVIGNLPTQGNVFFVNPYAGSDANRGTDIKRPLASLAQALTLVTANQNDIVYFVSTTDAATPTTNRVAAGGLDWNVDGVSLIGVCAPTHVSQRARISPATTDLTTNTVLTVSADNCLIANISVFHGVDGWTGAGGGVPTAVKVTGQHNMFKNVAFQGLGDATTTNSMDVANGSSLWLAGSENTFEGCYIGLETVPLGNTTAAALRISGAVSRNKFDGCILSTRGTHANHAQIQVGASGLQDMGAYFTNCQFTNSGIFTGGAAADGAFKINATQNGGILVNGSTCGAIGFTFWENATVSGKLYVSNPAVGAGKAGLGTVAVGT